MCNVHFMRAVLKNIPKKDKKEVAYMLKYALEDEAKMQKLAGVLLTIKDTKSPQIQLIVSDSIFGITNHFPDHTGDGSEPLTAWRESIRS